MQCERTDCAAEATHLPAVVISARGMKHSHPFCVRVLFDARFCLPCAASIKPAEMLSDEEKRAICAEIVERSGGRRANFEDALVQPIAIRTPGFQEMLAVSTPS